MFGKKFGTLVGMCAGKRKSSLRLSVPWGRKEDEWGHDKEKACNFV